MNTIVTGNPICGISLPANLFHILVQRCQQQAARLFDPYRPELHYMRGPGPKWREKHGLAARAIQQHFIRRTSSSSHMTKHEPATGA